MGRPEAYSEKLADEICDAISTIPRSIQTICEMHDHFPARAVIYRWLKNNKDFRDKYARAKLEQIHILVEDTLAIGEDSTEDFYDPGNDKLVINYAALQRKKMRMDAIQWYASKLVPRVYGPTMNLSDENGIGEEIYKLAKKVMGNK
jgi:hypothetical protein